MHLKYLKQKKHWCRATGSGRTHSNVLRCLSTISVESPHAQESWQGQVTIDIQQVDIPTAPPLNIPGLPYTVCCISLRQWVPESFSAVRLVYTGICIGWTGAASRDAWEHVIINTEGGYEAIKPSAPPGGYKNLWLTRAFWRRYDMPTGYHNALAPDQESAQDVTRGDCRLPAEMGRD